MQRRTNEWYQGLREASSEEDEEDIVIELETTFSKSPRSVARWTGSGPASNKSPPTSRSGRSLLKESPTPPLWTEVNLESGRESSRSSRSSGSNSSNFEVGFVRDRMASRSPPSAEDSGGLPSNSS